MVMRQTWGADRGAQAGLCLCLHHIPQLAREVLSWVRATAQRSLFICVTTRSRQKSVCKTYQPKMEIFIFLMNEITWLSSIYTTGLRNTHIHCNTFISFKLVIKYLPLQPLSLDAISLEGADFTSASTLDIKNHFSHGNNWLHSSYAVCVNHLPCTSCFLRPSTLSVRMFLNYIQNNLYMNNGISHTLRFHQYGEVCSTAWSSGGQRNTCDEVLRPGPLPRRP